ncbi:hypothetical protein I7I53_08364 [Histoplasma capsulatum var. duboisii H88]|uniref:Uncharacterized protein n=1 Tax=Ajellomyces capsulatus (strain H88) TaxID=544711 RepID=A0A8A1LJM9_AJEC8|nr:hypothetical protein I7I53_08364 [Histoplasma capsulatum var. duboisii H88]
MRWIGSRLGCMYPTTYTTPPIPTTSERQRKCSYRSLCAVYILQPPERKQSQTRPQCPQCPHGHKPQMGHPSPPTNKIISKSEQNLETKYRKDIPSVDICWRYDHVHESAFSVTQVKELKLRCFFFLLRPYFLCFIDFFGGSFNFPACRSPRILSLLGPASNFSPGFFFSEEQLTPKRQKFSS